MICSNCGKDIPYAGKVCPFCHVPKIGDKNMQALGMGVGGIAALLTWAFTNNLWYAVVAAVIGMPVGMILGYVFTRRSK